MSPESILTSVVILLVCGCAGLLLVRFDNSRLLGMGWLGAALGTGGTGAFLLLLDSRESPILAILVADVLVLASFVLLHLAVMEIVKLRGLPFFSLFLLLSQAGADIFKIHAHASGHFRVAVVGVLAAAQATYTVIILLRHADRAIRSPARFISLMLVGFTTWNLLRSLATVSGFLARRAIGNQVEVFTYVLYLAVAIGLAFGFFWMTTAGLTAKLEDLASTDPLTGALNRRAFSHCLQQEFDHSGRLGYSFALLMLDLDNFKQVNDRFGHLAGDEVLCAATKNIQDAVRGIDIVGRWGGEEFVILLPGGDLVAAQIVAQRILANIRRAGPLSDKSKHIPITASIGFAVRRRDDSVETMLLRADAALFGAKASGRNCVMGELVSV